MAADAWSEELKNGVCRVTDLLALLQLDAQAVDADLDPEFPLRVPRAFVRRMRRGDPRDPLLLQVLPRREERRAVAGFVSDPLQEGAAVLAGGVLQKYAGRVLLLAAGSCAVNCRYCFRRNFPYAEHRLPIVQESLQAVQDDPSVTEVIVSGGDPWMLTDDHFARLVDAVERIAHVRRLRVHTRLPVVIPSRVTPRLVARLAESRLATMVVLHVNHGNEIDAALAAAVERLRAGGVSTMNQSVLLAGVNDSVDTLAELSQSLFDMGVLPYYLHMLDPVAGAHHMLVEDAQALALHEGLRERLPGYLLPRLVREVPGAASKQWLRA